MGLVDHRREKEGIGEVVWVTFSLEEQVGVDKELKELTPESGIKESISLDELEAKGKICSWK